MAIIAAIETLSEERDRTLILVAMARNWSLAQEPVLYNCIRPVADQLTDPWLRFQSLVALIPQCPDQSRTEIIAAAKQATTVIEDIPFRITALCRISSHLPAPEAQACLTEARQIAQTRLPAQDQAKAKALLEIASHLPASEQTEVLASVVAQVEQSSSPWFLTSVLQQLANYGSAYGESDLLAVLPLVNSIENVPERIKDCLL